MSTQLQDPRIQAEAAVLGALMLDGKTFFELPPRLRAVDFHFRQHRVVFEAIAELAEKKSAIDILTLSNHLKDTGRVDEAGGYAYLTHLPNEVMSTANLGHWAQLVLDQSDARKLRWRLSEAQKIAADESIPILDRKAKVEHIISLDDADDEPIENERDVVKRVMGRIDQAADGEIAIRGMKTGLASLDEIFFANPTDLIAIGGRPGHGKSVMASQIADFTGMHYGPVLFIPLEMRADEVVTRRIMARGSLRIDDVRNPRTNDSAKRLLDTCTKLYDETRVQYFRCRELPTILRAATRMKRRMGLKLLVIDYLQRLNLWGLPGDNRDQQIGYATDKLKSWADDNEVTTLVLSQLSRPPKAPRVSRKPMPAPWPGLSDFRESGNIEADINAGMIMHVPGLIDGTPEAKAKDKSTAYAVVVKQRGGEAMVAVKLKAVFEHSRFAEPPPEEDEKESDQAAAEAEKRDARKPKQQRMEMPAEPKPDEDEGDH